MTKAGQDGFMALVSAVIISALLVVIVLGVGFAQIFSRLNVFDSESKERSSALAEACADQALLNFAQGSTYTGAVTVGTDSCNISSVQNDTPSSGQITIKTQGLINKSYTDLKVVADNSTLDIASWDECPVLASC